MKKLALVVAALAARGVSLSAQLPSVGADRFVGNWMGTLVTPGARLRLALTVARDSAGALSAVLTSLDQGNAKIPATVAVRGDTLVVSMTSAQATYTAALDAKGDSLRGEFFQGGALPLAMGRAAALPTPVRPQEPKPPFPYASEDVSFESVPGVRLSGTVLTPPGAGPFPAVVMVTGSGPQNRNEELLGHKPFLVIADYLARHGIASLRQIDRQLRCGDERRLRQRCAGGGGIPSRAKGNRARPRRDPRPQRRRSDRADSRGAIQGRGVRRAARRPGTARRFDSPDAAGVDRQGPGRAAGDDRS